ncbi:MAG: threonine aldolase family protein [Solirubrobacterales bacterium]
MISFYDTSTLPTEEMREAMRTAPLGDDVYGLDPTVNELEALAAEALGKEASVFMPSGTLANLAALLAHVRRGDEVVLEQDAHVVYYEAGGIAAVAGCMPLLVKGERGVIHPELIEPVLRRANVHYPPTSLIWVENTHNRAGGTITRPEVMEELRELADRRRLRLHVDGARLFHAAVALGAPASDLVAHADSVSFSLSKGLSAPVGSLLAGSTEFVASARRARKMLGGGMRQAGVVAAAGIVALRSGIHRLADDHARARDIAHRLSAIRGLAVDPSDVETNMVLVDTSGSGIPAAEVVQRLRADHDIRASATRPYSVRFVTHRQIGGAEVTALADALTETVGVPEHSPSHP